VEKWQRSAARMAACAVSQWPFPRGVARVPVMMLREARGRQQRRAQRRGVARQAEREVSFPMMARYEVRGRWCAAREQIQAGAEEPAGKEVRVCGRCYAIVCAAGGERCKRQRWCVKRKAEAGGA